MDPTPLRAGTTTHLKILAVALVASVAIVTVGINARTEHLPTIHATADSIVVTAGQPSVYAGHEAPSVR